ncbi:MAG TPA: FHA domain-containing protein [Gemmatimonadaceae bacterium]
MPVLIFGAQRRDVHPGRNTIGGTGGIAFSAFAALPPLAVITLGADGQATIGALAEYAHLLIDGESLGAEPRPLRDGSKLRIGDRELVYRAESTGQFTTAELVTGQAAAPLVSATGPDAGWRLIELQTGRIHEIPPQGMVIGRDDDCDLVVSSQDVSRRHAVIRKVRTGYVVTDESVNGTFVNDARVQSAQTLARGDKLRIGTTVFRLERSTPSASSTGAETQRVPSVTLPDPATDSEAAPELGNAPRTVVPVAPTELAALEAVGGPLGRIRFAVTRAVCSIGRTDENDIVISHESVSASHATILMKAGSWYAVDLRSANGTFVDGYRVAGERMLSAGSLLTVGQVKMIFWPASHASHEPHGTQPLLGMFQQLAKKIRGR